MTDATASRVRNLKFQGAAVDPAMKFIVATNNYRAFGGGNFPGLDAGKVVFDAPDENREALIAYLAQAGSGAGRTVDPKADGNWRILPVPGIRLTFLSGNAAIKYLPNHSGIGLIKDNGDGSALFELTR